MGESAVVHADPDLVAHLVSTTGLGEAEAARVVADVVAFHAEPLEVVVRRRHAQLRRRGLRNDEIYSRLRRELAARVVAPPALSERQLRRIVTG